MMGNTNNNAYLKFEKQTVLFLAFTVSAFALSLSFPLAWDFPAQYFQISHSVIETIGIVLVTLIFIVAWLPLQEVRQNRSTFLSCAFLGIGCMEFAHLITFDDTSSEALNSSHSLSVEFLRAAQGFVAIGLLLVAFCPAKPISKSAASYALLATILLSALIAVLLPQLAFETPMASAPTMGINNAFTLYSIVIAGLYGIAGISIWRRSQKTLQKSSIGLYTACALLAMSALLFNSDTNANEFTNFAGHTYKLFAYSFLFYALALSNVKEPFNEIQTLELRYQAILNALPDLVFEISNERQILHYHSGNNQKSLIADQKFYIGKRFDSFLSKEATQAC